MAHQVESMFSVRETPWHRLGRILDNPPTAEDAILAAGLDWTVSHAVLSTASGMVADTRAVIRSSDNAYLGDVGPDTAILQNHEAFAWFNPFIDSGNASFETAGSLRGGRVVWALARLNRDPSVIVPGSDDKVVKYLLLSNAHDGSQAVRVGFTPTRVVCANTLAIAHDGKASELLRIRHTAGMHDALTAVREIVDAANARFEATADQYRALAASNVANAEDLANYVRVVLRAEELTPEGNERKDPRALDSVVRLFEGGRGNTLPGVRGTWWAAYNAITEHLQYERRGTEETRMTSLAFGAGAKTSQRALTTALRMAA